MDSLGAQRQSCFRALREFLQERALVHCQSKLDTRMEGGRVEAFHLKAGASSAPDALGLIFFQVPQQLNDFDCGLYLLLFAEVFVSHTDKLLKSPSV